MKLRFLCVMLILLGCGRKDVSFYQNSFKNDKNDYLFIKYKVVELLNAKDSLYKFSVGFTGKRLTEDPYINDTTIFRFYNLHLDSKDQSKISNIMYKLNLRYVTVYRDSCKYIFSGKNQDTVVLYNRSMFLDRGELIDKDTYLFFAKQ